MGNKKSWFSFVKRLFISEENSKAEKKAKRWRWVSGRLKLKQYPALPGPHMTLREAQEEHSKRALAVAIATAAAADAAVAAVHAAAEVVRLTAPPQSYHECEKMIQNLAAIKIQTACRAYIARKALRALKGLVRLQAIARGQIARRRLITKLECLASIVKTISQVHQVRDPNVNESCKDGEKKPLKSPRKELVEKKKRLEQESPRNWDYSSFSKEDMETLRSRKQGTVITRECVQKHSSSSQEKINDQTPRESTSSKENGRQGFEKWGDAEAYKRRDTEKLKSTVRSNLVPSDTHRAQLKLRNVHKHDSGEELKSPLSLPRRSYCSPEQRSIGNDNSLPISPVFRTYMAATESAKAKARSISAPKQRLGFLDSCSDQNSPCKLRFSPLSSFNGEGTSTDRKSTETSQQISLRMK